MDMSSPLTTFGQITRKLRLERGEFLKDMAGHLGVSPAYLSAVERGRRKTPSEWVGRLQKAYRLSPDMVDQLTKAVAESRTHIKLGISHLSEGDKRIIRMMVERLPSFDEKEREDLHRIMCRETDV